MPFWYGSFSDEQVAAYQAWVSGAYDFTPTTPAPAGVPLREKPIHDFFSLDGGVDLRPGRRLRVAMMLKGTVAVPRHVQTYGEYYDWLMEERPKGAQTIPLQALGFKPVTWATEPASAPTTSDPELHVALQDLGYEIGEDIREACYALANPDIYYPGIDEGIDPVPDTHVELVIWALQRELNRELRHGPGGDGLLPAAPLTSLPWRVQRALAERRRWRYRQYGIGEAEWKANSWSLFNVPEDPEFVPRRAVRLATEK